MLFEKAGSVGSELLGVKYPILGGAMSWISDSELTSAICNAGGFGVLAGGSMPPELLVKEIEKTKELTKHNFGVNLITVSPTFKEQLDAVLKVKPSHVVFAGGLAPVEAIEAAKAVGTKVMAFAPSFKLGQRMVKAGADALIIEGHEAGGHVGPISTIVLIQKILFECPDTPVFVAGGIAKGKMIAHLLMMGAAGVQLGTRFVLTHEANVDDKMKKAFLKANSRDAIVSFAIDKRLPVIPVRTLKNEGTNEFMKLQVDLVEKLEGNEITREEAGLEVEKFWLGALRKAVKEGDLNSGSLMAGHSVGLIKDIKGVGEVIEELVEQAENALIELKEKINNL